MSRGFPLSLVPPLHSHGLPRASCDTLLTTTHFPPTPPPSSLIYPLHLPFGDTTPVPKLDSHFWIGFCNIGVFPAIAGNNKKVLDIKHFIVAHDLDLFGGCEANLNWHSLLDPVPNGRWLPHHPCPQPSQKLWTLSVWWHLLDHPQTFLSSYCHGRL